MRAQKVMSQTNKNPQAYGLPGREAGATAMPQPNQMSQMLGRPMNEAGATAMPSPNAYDRFKQGNPNATPGMTPEQIRQILMSPQFQQSNRNFTDR
jgi:hypothetical protein